MFEKLKRFCNDFVNVGNPTRLVMPRPGPCRPGITPWLEPWAYYEQGRKVTPGLADRCLCDLFAYRTYVGLEGIRAQLNRPLLCLTHLKDNSPWEHEYLEAKFINDNQEVIWLQFERLNSKEAAKRSIRFISSHGESSSSEEELPKKAAEAPPKVVEGPQTSDHVRFVLASRENTRMSDTGYETRLVRSVTFKDAAAPTLKHLIATLQSHSTIFPSFALSTTMISWYAASVYDTLVRVPGVEVEGEERSRAAAGYWDLHIPAFPDQEQTGEQKGKEDEKREAFFQAQTQRLRTLSRWETKDRLSKETVGALLRRDVAAWEAWRGERTLPTKEYHQVITYIQGRLDKEVSKREAAQREKYEQWGATQKEIEVLMERHRV